jgi:hypothetical protein
MGTPLKTPWRSGPAHGTQGSVLISVTDLRLNTALDMPGAFLAAMRLRRAWPDLGGAVGMWLWARPLQKRSGAVSVWQGETDLLRFVRWPVHVAIMRHYRDAGELSSVSWDAEHFEGPEIWRKAARMLSDGEPTRTCSDGAR